MEQFSQYNAETRFIPYIEMHEFEALLFSDADILAEKTGINIVEIKKVIEAYDNPEEINEDPEKAPSKRLEKLKTGYRKVGHGENHFRSHWNSNHTKSMPSLQRLADNT